MNIKKEIKRLYKFIYNLPAYYKDGGVVKIEVSTINYGGHLFSDNDVILITGGTRGIGLNMAKRFLQEGATVIVTGKNHARIEKLKSEITDNKFICMEWDISNISDIEVQINSVTRELGKEITVLINNAGIYAKSNFPHSTNDDWDRVYTTNVKGPFFLTQAICKYWINNPSTKYRKIINISSQGGFVGANNAYRMTKWDLRGFTEYLGQSICKHGIIANGIAPGIIMTDMQPKFKQQGENFYTEYNPANRVALPLEIAELAVFLASNAANYIIGQTIVCDGGYILK